jgi:hypothetical protein
MAEKRSRCCLGCLGNGCFWLFVVGLMLSAWANSGLCLRILEAISLVAVLAAALWVRRRSSPNAGPPRGR